jgi:hypothetical protein
VLPAPCFDPSHALFPHGSPLAGEIKRCLGHGRRLSSG